MDRLLEQLGNPEYDELAQWKALIGHLRPPRANDTAGAETRLLRLIDMLKSRPALRQRLSDAFRRMFRERKQVSLYASSGLLPSTGFFSETARRISGRLLPDYIDTAYMKDVLAVLFWRPDDEVWVNAVSDELWCELICTVLGNETPVSEIDGRELPGAIAEILEALRVLSYHASAIGLDPEFIRIDPDLEEHESVFLAQNAELVAYIRHYAQWWATSSTLVEDEKHVQVMLDQCDEVLQRIRRRAAKLGTSLTLTFKLERLQQHLRRMGRLVHLLAGLRKRRMLADVAPQIVALFKELVRAECRKHRLSDYLGKNVELLSRRMTESASKTGEHYITATRREYFGILGSAALGGFIIALMAAFKLVLAKQGNAPLTAALTFCLNYGIGFVIIHVIGGTVATKQPAMTANAIAASIGETRGKTRDLDNLVELIARTIRSQLAAIVGNIGIAIPVATVLGVIVHATTGAHFVSPEKARVLLDEIDPVGGAVFFAALAGVCLFLSGLISGYYDNLCAYGRIPDRLLQLRWPRLLLGARRMERIAAYVENNLGVLAGNFFFGFLLGGVTALGVLLGLPLDIRHIAFSSAYVGYASVGLDFALGWKAAALAAGGIALIGLTNLAVSFSLTLYVAMRARRITFAQGRTLVWMTLRRFLARPQDFFFPPRNQLTPEQRDTAKEIGTLGS
ncbi:site-specific recombinase [Azoarcus sp. DN11]|uniref:site-specific recombinase n=1 Tax=Azoarcus sp. DN11 TaxID=356837 RepID=UPI000EB0C922|nr:site-specific recombinase [Azoarcus sp. DN11]AYH42337.1 preprotein translocase subunit TatB [Azoarcus sp. DN11]